MLCLWVVFQDPIKPHEKRALNFLVHEYLIQLENKLTAITFSEENGDQVSPKAMCVCVCVRICVCACVRVCVCGSEKLFKASLAAMSPSELEALE